MILISEDIIDKTIKYLNDFHGTEQNVYIKIAEGYDVIETSPNGPRGFGVFDPSNRVIYVPSLMEDDELVRTIAHEYRHFMQYCNGARAEEDFDEEDAEMFADYVLKQIKETT